MEEAQKLIDEVSKDIEKARSKEEQEKILKEVGEKLNEK